MSIAPKLLQTVYTSNSLALKRLDLSTLVGGFGLDSKDLQGKSDSYNGTLSFPTRKDLRCKSDSYKSDNGTLSDLSRKNSQDKSLLVHTPRRLRETRHEQQTYTKPLNSITIPFIFPF